MPPPSDSGITPTLLRALLDPDLEASDREGRRRRYFLGQLPRTRAMGTLVLMVGVLLHVYLIPGSGTLHGVLAFWVGGTTYALGSWTLSRWWVATRGDFRLPSFWYALDPLLWNAAILATGAQASWLFVTLVIGVASHVAISSRLVVGVGVWAILAYAGVVGLHYGGPWSAFPWGQEFTKLVVFGCGLLYFRMVSQVVSSIRADSANLLKLSRSLNHDLQRQAEELALAKNAAEEHDRAKSLFLANMSHELRTPLNAIILYSELIESEAEQGGGGPLMEDAHRILGAGHQLLSLVNDLLDLSKIEAGHMTFKPETIFVPDLIRELETAVGTQVRKHGNQLVVEDRVTADPAFELVADPLRLRQILVNLTSNAAKFTENGTISLRVLAYEGTCVAFEVEDTGIGMTEEQAGRVFQDFIQADEETPVKYGGTGLGLSLSRRLAERMGGRIEVTSSYGEGSLFRVVLPLRPPGT